MQRDDEGRGNRKYGLQPQHIYLVILEATQKKILWLGSTPEKCLYGNILMNSLFE